MLNLKKETNVGTWLFLMYEDKGEIIYIGRMFWTGTSFFACKSFLEKNRGAGAGKHFDDLRTYITKIKLKILTRLFLS